MPLFLAIVIATVSTPIITWLEKRRVPRVVAILAAVGLDLAVIAGMGTLVGSSLNGFMEALPRYQASLADLLHASIASLEARGVPISGSVSSQVADVSGVMDLVATLVGSVMSVVSSSLVVLLLVVFILFELGRWRLKIGYAMGTPFSDLTKVTHVAGELQKYLFVKTGMNLVTGVLCGAWAAVLGVDFPVLWGLIAFLLNSIPTIGSIIAGIPVVGLAWLQFGPGTAIGAAIGAAIGYVVINVTLGQVVEPRIMGKALGLSPLVVFVSMVFWWWLWGPIGALLSAPLTMGVKIALAQTVDLRWIAIMLGSAHWVEEMNEEWARARPTLTPQPGRFCVRPEGQGPTSRITHSEPGTRSARPSGGGPERRVTIDDPTPPPT